MRWRKYTFWVVIGGILLCIFEAPLSLAQQNDKELFQIAQKAFEDGFYDVTISYIEQLLKEFPQTDKRIQSNLLLGQCYFFKNQYLKAYDVFQNLLAYQEFKDATLFWLGETYLKGADYQQAEKYYRELIEIYPDSVYVSQAYYSLGWLLFLQDKLDDAEVTFEKLLTQFPDQQSAEEGMFKLGEIFYRRKEYQKAIEHFQTFLEKYPQSTKLAEAFFYIGECSYYQNDFGQAISYYAKTAETAYDKKLILTAKISLGWSHLKLKRYPEAKQALEEAALFAQQKNISSEDIFLGLASLYTESKKYPEALEAYSHLIRQFPESLRLPEACLGRANTYYQLMNYAQAIEDYLFIIKQFTGKTKFQEIVDKAYFGLAWSYVKTGDTELAIKTFHAIKDQTKNHLVKISALTQIGDAYHDIGEFQKAIDIYDNILKSYPDSIYGDYVQYRQGIALLKMDKIEAATLSLESLKTNFPQSEYLDDVKYYLAFAYFKKGLWSQAKNQIEEFIQNPPAEGKELLAQAHYILGLSLFNLQEYEQASQIFEKIIKTFSDQTTIVKNSELNLAKSIYKLEDFKRALKEFQNLLVKYPQTEIAEEALLWLADHHLGVSEWEKAALGYEAFLKDFPGSERKNLVLFHLGQTYQALKKLDLAVHSFRQIDESLDRDLFAKAQLAIAEIFTKDLDAASTIDTYQNIIKTSPEFKRDAYIKIAEAYKELNNFTEAVEAYKAALHSEKKLSEFNNAELQFYVADCYELLNQKKKASEEYLKIPYLYAQESSWVIKAYLRSARIFEEEGDWEQAKLVYNKILASEAEEAKFAKERLEWIEQNVQQY